MGGQKSCIEVAYLTIRAFTAKNSLPQLTEKMNEMVAAPDSPGGRITDARFRKTLEEAAMATLPIEEVHAIFPPPPEEKVSSRRPSKRGSKESVDSDDTSRAQTKEK